LRRQAVLPFLTFEPELQAKTDQKWLKNLEKRLQYAHEVPVLDQRGHLNRKLRF
jgi:hypothetical protein